MTADHFPAAPSDPSRSQAAPPADQVTVVVVTFNSAGQLPGLLDALPEALDGVRLTELVVADNDSSDDTLDVVRQRAPHARIVRVGRNAGYAAGLNAALASAAPTGSVLLLNPDTRPHPGSVRRLVAALAEGAGIAVPRLLDADGNLAHSLRRDPSVARAWGEALLGGRRAGRVSRLGEVVADPEAYERPGSPDWATGAVMLLSRACLDAVGPWDESFFLYSEETDFALRARDAGFSLRYVPGAVVTHVGGDVHGSPRLWSILAVNRVRLFSRRHGPLRGAAFRLGVMVNEALRLATGRPTHRAALLALMFPFLRPHEVRRDRRPRRVLIIVANLSVPFDRRVWLESQALMAAGYGVSVICPQAPGDEAYQELDGVRIHRYPPAPEAKGAAGFFWEFAYSWLRTAALTLRVWRSDGFDVVQACNPPDTFWALAAPLKLLGKRFVFDQHDLCPEVYQSRFGRSGTLLHRGLLFLERMTYRTADHVIATNESYRDIAIRRGGRAPQDVTVVRNGPDPERMRRGEPQPALKRGREHLCCYLGVMGPQDGVDLVLEATDVLVHRMGRTDVHVALLGFGDCLEDLRRRSTELGLDDHVTFTGRADDTMIRAFLSTADVALSPDPKDAFNDVSTMNKTMEYMAFGLPVVAFDLKETRVSGADAAVYTRPNDVPEFAEAVAALLDDPERRALMGKLGRQRVEDVLAWPYQRDAYVGVYDRLLRPRTAPARW